MWSKANCRELSCAVCDVYTPDDFVLPLSEGNAVRLDVNRPTLLQYIATRSPSQLFDALVAKKALSRRDVHVICNNKETDIDINSALLDTISRKGDDAFKALSEALRKGGSWQGYLADVLEGKGLMIGLTASFKVVASAVSARFHNSWTSLPRELKLPREDLEYCKRENRQVQDKVLNALVRWRRLRTDIYELKEELKEVLVRMKCPDVADQIDEIDDEDPPLPSPRKRHKKTESPLPHEEEEPNQPDQDTEEDGGEAGNGRKMKATLQLEHDGGSITISLGRVQVDRDDIRTTSLRDTLCYVLENVKVSSRERTKLPPGLEMEDQSHALASAGVTSEISGLGRDTDNLCPVLGVHVYVTSVVPHIKPFLDVANAALGEMARWQRDVRLKEAVAYLQELGVEVVRVSPHSASSVVFVVLSRSMTSLTSLWEQYRQGYLRRMFQRTLVNERLLRKISRRTVPRINVRNVTVETYMNEEHYKFSRNRLQMIKDQLVPSDGLVRESLRI
ncbi:uncharacterized protein LOC144914311 isoform X1 [Branchiostoma floridae x Branchiostoma belcheri]